MNIGGGRTVPPKKAEEFRDLWKKIEKDGKDVPMTDALDALVKLYIKNAPTMDDDYRKCLAGAIIGLTKLDSCETLLTAVKVIAGTEIGKFGTECMAKAICTVNPSLLKEDEDDEKKSIEPLRAEKEVAKLKAKPPSNDKKAVLDKYEKKWSKEGRTGEGKKRKKNE